MKLAEAPGNRSRRSRPAVRWAGACPAAQLDTPIDYESMRAMGSIMGSGGLIVMDESTCMVDMARYFIGFAQSESCGNCTPCRIGTRILMDTLEKIARGEGEPRTWKSCASRRYHGQNLACAAWARLPPTRLPAACAISCAEYEATSPRNSARRRCARICSNTTSWPESCSGCGLCVEVCTGMPSRARRKELHTLDVDQCMKCHSCVSVCARDAIVGIPVAPQPVPAILHGEAAVMSVHITIDERSLSVEKGTTILQAARQHRYLHPDPVRFSRPALAWQLPDVHRGDPGQAKYPDRLHHPGRRGHGHPDQQPQGPGVAGRTAANAAGRASLQLPVLPGEKATATNAWSPCAKPA